LDEIIVFCTLGGVKGKGVIRLYWIMYDKSDVTWMMHGQNKYITLHCGADQIIKKVFKIHDYGHTDCLVIGVIALGCLESKFLMFHGNIWLFSSR
jgi:hypothetical protein